MTKTTKRTADALSILGDGVVGRTIAQALRAHDVPCTVAGDGAALGQPCAIAHRYAGRSFVRPPIEQAAWSRAEPFLEQLVERGVATRRAIARPLVSRAGVRLASTLEHAPEVQRVTLPHGECLLYEPVFVVDVPAALGAISAVDAASCAHPDILAVGAAWRSPHVAPFGGHLVQFACEPLDYIVAGGGVHIIPTPSGTWVGSTFWPQHEPVSEQEAVATLRARAAQVGVELGDALQVWCGFRAVSSDRLPCLGRSGDAFVAGAFGSRAWTFAAYCAEVTVAHLLHGEPLPPELDLARF